MTENYKVLAGDALIRLMDVEDESVHLVMTSPPYYSIKEYSGKPEEIGHNQTFVDYIKELQAVFRESMKKLHPGCYMAINIGDQFMSTTEDKAFHILPVSAYLLMSIHLLDAEYMGTITWRKVSNTTTSGGGKIMGSAYYPRDGHFLINKEYIHFFKKNGKYDGYTDEQRELSKIKPWERKEWFKSDWNIPGEKQKVHQAPFPIELPYRVIRMRTMVGETVLDPFMGTGSTIAAALKAGRKGIGIELGWTDGDEWMKIVKDRIDSVSPAGKPVSSNY